MSESNQGKEPRASYATARNQGLDDATVNLESPIILERDGQPVAVLMSIQEYERYQALLEKQQIISALEARRAADRVVFGDLVGCALSSGTPIWSPEPEPRWRVPYHLFDGTLLTTVEVDARTQTVLLTDEERLTLLERVERLAKPQDATS